jgi:hypothetical protein
MTPSPEGNIGMLRHAVATLAYRAGKVLRGAPEEFSNFALAAPQTPGRILAHLCDLFDWALTLANGAQQWRNSEVGSWEADSARFFETLQAFDRRLADATPLGCDPERLFQGPVADALTHVGQIAMLRRLAGVPISGENYFVAKVSVGRSGADQAAPVYEF